MSIADQTINSHCMQSYNLNIFCLVVGRLMCEHFLSVETMRSFLRLSGSETLLDLVKSCYLTLH